MLKSWKGRTVLAMTNLVVNWWRSIKFRAALKKGDNRLARQLLQEIQKSGGKLSLLERQFKETIQLKKSLRNNTQELKTIKFQYNQACQRIENLEKLVDFFPPDDFLLIPDAEFVRFIVKTCQITEHDEGKLQCTGIDERTFNEFEASLVEYLKSEFYNNIKSDRFKKELKEAQEDIENLKRGQDPQYSLKLTPHVYFMRYFLENVYCAYLAWFLIYKAGLLPRNLNILDIAAGPGTIAYGLALLLRSSSEFFEMPKMHVSYYSLEQLSLFQDQGLKFWREYIEPQHLTPNIYFKFDPSNIFDYSAQFNKLPEKFFDFIVISHCQFSDPEKRIRSHQLFKEMFMNSLKEEGYVLLIVQDKKLFKSYNVRQSEDIEQEQKLVYTLVGEMGLKLVWYKYLTSTNRRTPMSGAEFAKFADENLPSQTYMAGLMKEYLGIKHNSNYALDDYVILAQRG